LLPPAVWLLGWVSLFTDTASEAIYPLLPLFLTRVLGARALAIGLVEGAAEAASSVLKVVSGRVADRSGKRRPLVIAGYSLSSLARPLIGAAGSWGQVFALRLVDRVGKGIRSAPRDAILASVASPATRGRVFGFHRAMDHTGAIIGPLLAAAFLWVFPGYYRALFLLTLVPGLAVVVLVLRVPRDAPAPVPGPVTASPVAAPLPASLRKLFVVLFVFALGNSTDAYLLLRLSNLGVTAAAVPLLWAGLHVVKASSSVMGGVLADRWGRRPMILVGWLFYAAVYAGFAVVDSRGLAVALFLSYGLYFGLTEGVEKALVADLSPEVLRGSAFGVYNAVTGFGALGASVLFGAVWEWRGAESAFLFGSVIALLASVLFAAVVPGAGVPARTRG
jgi:MFS family permease